MYAQERPFYLAYFMGNRNNVPYYTEPQQVYGTINTPTALSSAQSIGIDFPYERVIYARMTRDFEFIDEQAILWIDIKPNGNEHRTHDFNVTKVSDVDSNGNFQIYCERNAYYNVDFWYEHDGVIFQKQIPLDLETNIAIIPKRMYLPIDVDSTACWKFNPNDNLDAERGKLLLDDREDAWDCWVLHFKEVPTTDSLYA